MFTVIVDYCAGLCGKKTEKVEPHLQSKRVEKYYHEPEGSVVEVHKIQNFQEEPVIIAEPPQTTVVVKIRRKKYRINRRPSDEYDNNKYSVLNTDDAHQLDSYELARDNTYVTSHGTSQHYLPDIVYTYDGEEERRRRRRRKKKKSGRHRQEEDLPRNNGIVTEERIERAGVLRSSTKSRRSEHGDIEVVESTIRSRDYEVVAGPEYYYEQE